MSSVENPTVCIARPSMRAASETFIDQHAQMLPTRIVQLWSGYSPTRRQDGHSIFNPAEHAVWRVAQRVRQGTRLHDVARQIEVRAQTRFFKKQGVRVVLAEFGPTAVHLLPACRQSGIPLVAHFHGYDAHAQPTLRRYQDEYREMFGETAAIVAVSTVMRRKLLDMGAREDQLHLIPCGCHPSVFEYRKQDRQELTCLAVGRFVEKKAPHLTILAFAKAHEVLPKISLIMVGDGPLLAACKQLARSLKLESAIQFAGSLNHPQVLDLMASSSVFVQHSCVAPNGDMEGTPVAVIEACASGMGVAATRHAGIQDVIRDGETGLLVDEYDVDGFGDAMIRLFENPDLCRSLGEQARSYASRELSAKGQINKLWDVLQAAGRLKT